MRVMITGGTGFVGYHTALALLNAGHEVSLLIRSEEKLRRLFGDRVRHFAIGDITDADAIGKAMQGCDAVMHSAAMVSVHARDADKVYNTNVDGTRLVIDTALDRGVGSILHVSSVTALFDPEAKVLDEHSPPGTAESAYGRSKVTCEKFVRELQDQGAPIHISYPASVIGPDDPGLTEPSYGLKMYLTAFVPMMPSGNQYVDVRDVAEAHRRLLTDDAEFGRYPIGGHFIPWRALPDLLKSLTGQRIVRLPVGAGFMRTLGRIMDTMGHYVDVEAPVTHEAMVYATNWVNLDNSKVEQTLGLVFRDVEETFSDAIRWLYQAGHIEAKHAGRLA